MHTYFMHASLFGMYSNTIYLTTAVIIVLSQSAAELVIAPNNAESKVGDTAYFNCSTNLMSGEEIFWYHGSQYIYIGDAILDPYRGRFEIDRNASIGSHNLVIHSVEPSDAGQYMCVDDDGHGTKRSAELVVLDNDPFCQSNIQPDGVIGQNIFSIPPDDFQLTCTVTYHGKIPPEIVWKKVGDDSFIKDSMVSNITSTDRSILTLKLKGDILLDGSSFVCQTRRSKQKQYKCSSEVIKVLYFVGGNTTEVNVIRGDKITCIAKKSTFSCASQWYQDNYTCPLSCDETITTHLLGEYLCTMKCHVRGADHYFDALKVFVYEEPAPLQSSTSGKITASIIVVPIIIAVILLIVAVLVGLRFRKRRKPKNVEEAIQYTMKFAQDVVMNLGEEEKKEYFQKSGIDPKIFISDYLLKKLKTLVAEVDADETEEANREQGTRDHLMSSQSFKAEEKGDGI